MARELIINYHSLFTRLAIHPLQSVTIAVSDAEGERERSEYDLGDPDRNHIDSYETPRHQMDLRTRRVRKAGYREVISRIGTEGKGIT